MGSIPGSGKSPGGGHDNPLQYSCLKNPMGRGAWQATVHRVAKSQTWLKQLNMHACNSVITCCFLVASLVKNQPAMREIWVRSLGWEDPLEKEMATHSSILAWRTPWTEEPGGLQSTGSQRIGHNWTSDLTVVSLILILIFILMCHLNAFYSAITLCVFSVF